MINLIAWLGSILLALCGLPQAVKSYKTGKADDISLTFLLMWLFGELLIFGYIISKSAIDIPLLFNYGANIFFISVILKFKLYPRLKPIPLRQPVKSHVTVSKNNNPRK